MNNFKRLLLWTVILTFVLQSFSTRATSTQSNTTFKSSITSDLIYDTQIENCGKYIVYRELNNHPTDMLVDQYNYIYIDETTLKIVCSFKGGWMSRNSEKYAIVLRHNATDPTKYNRCKIEIATGIETILKESIQVDDQNCYDCGEGTFVCKDAIYFLNQNMIMDDIIIEANLWEIPKRQVVRYEQDSKTYLIDLKTQKILEDKTETIDGKSYESDLEVGTKPQVTYILDSLDYGIIFLSNDEVLWQKIDGSFVSLGMYQSGTEYMSDLKGLNVGLNSTGEWMYLINSPQYYKIIDLKKGIINEYKLPGDFTGLVFKPASQYPAFFYKDTRLAQQLWMSNINYVLKNGCLKEICTSAMSYLFKSNLIFFETDVQVAGHSDMWSTSIAVYNMNTDKILNFTGLNHLGVTQNCVYAKDNFPTTYILNEKTLTWRPVLGKKLIGAGITMVADSDYVTFMDSKGNTISACQLNGTCLAVIPGWKSGFVYQAGKLIKVSLPDAKRITKAADVEISGNVLMYHYYSSDKKIVNVRLVKF